MEHSTVVIEAGWMGIYSYKRNFGIADVLKHNKNIIKQWSADKLKIDKGNSGLENTGQALNEFIDDVVLASERCVSSGEIYNINEILY